MTERSPNIAAVDLPSHGLLGEGSWLADLRKAAGSKDRMGSAQGDLIGRIEHLIDYDRVAELKDQNVHHSAALEAKVHASVGLGHRDEKISETLDPYCEVSWQETIDAVMSDFFEFANGYLEVVRDEDGAIRGLHHLPARDVAVCVEDHRQVFHYEIADKGNMVLSGSLSGLRFARFGERDEFIARQKILPERRGMVSEVIHFPLNRGRRSSYYGYPDWIAATSSMELDHCVTQYSFDFFFNGGMPEAIFNIIGKRVDVDDWAAIKQQFERHVGIGNKRKVMLLNLGDPDMTVQLDKLTVDGQTTGDHQPTVDSLALKILSAHRTPPILAGVTQPGKMGANNEVTNAMMLFHLLVTGPVQKLVSQILARTIGDPALNGGLGLTAAQFFGVGTGDPEPDPTKPPDMMTGMPATRPADHKGNGFRTIMDELDLGKAETVGKMRMSMAEAGSRGRDLSAGVAERGSDVKAKRGDKS